jgi:hypothetical protein
VSARWPHGLLFCGAILAYALPARADTASTPAPRGASPALPPPQVPNAPTSRTPEAERTRPPPLHVEYLQYGVAVVAETNLYAGAICDTQGAPCILGSAGGLVIRGGYRSAGPWYIGGAYQFAKMDSSNLFRLGIFQQLRFEMRYLPDIGYRAAPFASWGVGALAYGNEWGVTTGGGLAFGGAGVELEVSRVAVIGFSVVYRPMLIAGFRDSAGAERSTGLAHFLGAELQFELRSEIGRR